ncbi:MAG: glycosyltransferase family 4 protein [Isosphaeraceae bacterium]
MPDIYAIVAADFVPWGGMDRPNYELARYLAERDRAEVHLVSHRVASPLAEHPRIVWHRVPRPMGRDTLGSPFLDRVGKRVARDVAGAGGTVVVNGGNCLWNDVNWIHYVHNTPMAERGSPSWLRREWIRWKRRRDQRRERQAVVGSRLVITDSELMKERLVEGLSVDPTLVQTIYYGIDPEVFRPASAVERVDARRELGLPLDRPLVAFVGALGDNRRKGFDILFHAWLQCRQHARWDAMLVVAGAGPELPYWKRRSAEAGCGDEIRFPGFTEAVSGLLAAADALVSPTRFEPYGQGVHEAICCGLPVFVTRCAGIAERFPAELHHLLLEDPPKAAQLCERLLDWHEDIDGYRRRILPFAEQLRRRTWTDMAADLDRAMNGAGSPPPRPNLRSLDGDDRHRAG